MTRSSARHGGSGSSASRADAPAISSDVSHRPSSLPTSILTDLHPHRLPPSLPTFLTNCLLPYRPSLPTASFLTDLHPYRRPSPLTFLTDLDPCDLGLQAVHPMRGTGPAHVVQPFPVCDWYPGRAVGTGLGLANGVVHNDYDLTAKNEEGCPGKPV
eukprot:356136-Chlamydomonas_euryale.AAC.3